MHPVHVFRQIYERSVRHFVTFLHDFCAMKRQRPEGRCQYGLFQIDEEQHYTNSQLKCPTERIRFLALTKPSAVRRYSRYVERNEAKSGRKRWCADWAILTRISIKQAIVGIPYCRLFYAERAHPMQPDAWSLHGLFSLILKAGLILVPLILFCEFFQL